MKLNTLLFNLLVFLVLSNFTFSQSIQKKYTQNNGLPSYNIRYTIKDLNGYLWICTQDGLSKFDGIEFKNYTSSSKNQQLKIDFSDCRSMFIDSTKNELWVMGADAGFNIINCNTGNIVQRYLYNFADIDTWLISCKKIKNEVWIGTNKGLWVFDMSLKNYKKFPLFTSKLNQKVSSINTDNIGNLWVFIDGEGLVIIETASKKIIHTYPLSFFSKNYNPIILCSAILDDKLFVGTNKGLSIFKIYNYFNLSATNLSVQKAINNEEVKYLGITNEALFIGCNKFIKVEKNLIDYKVLSQSIDDNSLTEINTSCAITTNLIALGCNSGLAIFDTDEPAFTAVVNNQAQYKNKLKHLYGLFPIDSISILAATQNGLFKIANNKIETIVDNVFYQNICVLSPTELLVSNDAGWGIYTNNHLISIEKSYPEFRLYKNWEINKCIKLNDSIYILSSENDQGLLLWIKSKKTVTPINTVSKPLALQSNIINTIYKDDKELLWILSDFSVSIIDFNKNTIRTLQIKTPNQQGLFFDMVQVKNDYWLAVYGIGIIVLDEFYKIKKIIAQNEGICNGGVYKIFSATNAVFVSTNNGISSINKSDYTINNFFTPYNGLHGNAFEEACGAQVNGKIYFGGLDGFTIINPLKIKKNSTPPTLYFKNIEIETDRKKIDTSNIEITNLTIPNNYTQAKVAFIGINYQNPERVNYWYRIVEFGDKWIDLKNQNFIDFIGFSSGKYHLQVKAANEDGVECKPIEMVLQFLPKWYQTLLFKILLVLVTILFLYLLYSFRIKQLKKVLAVRQTISQNLHDDIGSTLSAINMYTQVAKLQPTKNDFLNSIETNTQDVLSKLDDIIWSTNPKNDSLQNLVERMDGFARPLCHAKNVQFIFNESVGLYQFKLTEKVRQYLFLIFKEAINNALKYAVCNKISVQLGVKNKNISCTVTDDGIGFNVATNTERNGLLNMQLRAKELKGSFKIESNSSGTTVSITLPT